MSQYFEELRLPLSPHIEVPNDLLLLAGKHPTPAEVWANCTRADLLVWWLDATGQDTSKVAFRCLEDVRLRLRHARSVLPFLLRERFVGLPRIHRQEDVLRFARVLLDTAEDYGSFIIPSNDEANFSPVMDEVLSIIRKATVMLVAEDAVASNAPVVMHCAVASAYLNNQTAKLFDVYPEKLPGKDEVDAKLNDLAHWIRFFYSCPWAG